MTEALRTLVVDDDDNVRFFLDAALQRAGHDVTCVSSGEHALTQMRESTYDLVILDLRLGRRIDGQRVLEAIKLGWPETMVIILTGHGSLESAMAAIQEGVDGYLLKPIEPSELLQAVRDALDRRTRQAQLQDQTEASLLRHGPLVVDVERYMATLHGEAVELTPKEFDLLVHLMRNPGRVSSPQELVRIVQGFEADHVHEARQIIKWYVHRLRAKLEPDPSNPCYIINVRGVGYTLGDPPS
jgi:DNA-binding response OmpR family regulator